MEDIKTYICSKSSFPLIFVLKFIVTVGFIGKSIFELFVFATTCFHFFQTSQKAFVSTLGQVWECEKSDFKLIMNKIKRFKRRIINQAFQRQVNKYLVTLLQIFISKIYPNGMPNFKKRSIEVDRFCRDWKIYSWKRLHVVLSFHDWKLFDK